jgi:hypothetical protein
MFLVENLQPNSRSIGPIILSPGHNKIDPKLWETTMLRGFKDVVEKLADDKIIRISGEKQKLTVAIVEKTYDVPTLKSMLEEARGPLKGAVKKQLKMITESEEVENAEAEVL